MEKLKSAFAGFVVSLWPVRWAINIHNEDCRRATLALFGEDPDTYR